MSERKEKLTRREALTALGTAAAATAILTTAAKNVAAQAQIMAFVVDTYRAYYYSAPQFNYDARIILYNAGASLSCSLYFMKPGEAIPTNTLAANGVSSTVGYDGGRLEFIREFLRNERPVRFTFNAANGIATLSNDEYELIGDADV